MANSSTTTSSNTSSGSGSDTESAPVTPVNTTGSATGTTQGNKQSGAMARSLSAEQAEKPKETLIGKAYSELQRVARDMMNLMGLDPSDKQTQHAVATGLQHTKGEALTVAAREASKTTGISEKLLRGYEETLSEVGKTLAGVAATIKHIPDERSAQLASQSLGGAAPAKQQEQAPAMSHPYA